MLQAQKSVGERLLHIELQLLSASYGEHTITNSSSEKAIQGLRRTIAKIALTVQIIFDMAQTLRAF
jgi:hypothetical protein